MLYAAGMSHGGMQDGTGSGMGSGTFGGTRRLPVNEAAAVLGISTEATRQRVKRGTLSTERDENGNVFVLLDDDGTGGGTRSDNVGTADGTPLIAAKDETIQALKEQLAAWQEESRRKDHIIAALTERIPELEAPREASSEAQEGHEAASEGVEKGTAPPEPQEPSQRRSWWRAFFGLE